VPGRWYNHQSKLKHFTNPQSINAMPSHHGLTDNELEALATVAIKAKKHAYCPYSNFRVGACVLVSSAPESSFNTKYHHGSNVEVASTPVGICAERCALAQLVASYERPDMPKIRAIAVSTDISPPASPCGMCRQFIREFCEPDVRA
jgi:cytidine deaminase